MNSEQVFVGIDIGTTEVRTVVGMLAQDQEIPSVIGAGTAPNHGMRRGVVVNIDEVAASIALSIQEAERISGQHLTQANVNINGSHITSLSSKGVVAISSVDKEITIDDIARAEAAAAVVQLPANNEILQVFARNFHLDGQENIKDPIGMNGVRLEIEALIVTASTPAVKSLHRAMDHAGIATKHHIVSGLAASEAVLSQVQRESGSVLIDIGATTTNIVVVEEDDVQHVAVLPVGSLHITNDLAIGLKTDLEVANIVKLTQVNLASEKQRGKKLIKIEYHDEIYTFDSNDINAVVEARLEELFELINTELKSIAKDGRLPGGAVLVGGGSLLPGIEELAKKILGLPAQVGETGNYSGIVEVVKSPRYATAVGLMLLDMRLRESEDIHTAKHGSISSKISGLLKKFIP